MPSFTTILYFLLIWSTLSLGLFGLWVTLVLLGERIQKRRERNAVPQTLIQRFHDDCLQLNFYILNSEQEETERIFSVDSFGETICSHDHQNLFYQQDARPYWAPLFDTVITVDDNESHDMFRNNAAINQL